MRFLTALFGLQSALFLASTPALADDHKLHESEEVETDRHKVLGLGGLFFRAQDPAVLAAWYERHLGINPVPKSYEEKPWMQEAGPTVFSPFPANSTRMGEPTKPIVLNFRVADLDGMVSQLQVEGVEVEVDPQTYPNGRFATLSDPEGNPIQLWEPATP